MSTQYLCIVFAKKRFRVHTIDSLEEDDSQGKTLGVPYWAGPCFLPHGHSLALRLQCRCCWPYYSALHRGMCIANAKDFETTETTPNRSTGHWPDTHTHTYTHTCLQSTSTVNIATSQQQLACSNDSKVTYAQHTKQ